MCPQTTSSDGSQVKPDGEPPPKREVPQFALDFIESLNKRRAGMDGDFPGASAAERHLLETGHRLEAGCCARAAERKEASPD